MATILKLADKSNGVSYDFLTGVLRFQIDTWTTTPSGEEGMMLESVTLRAVGTDANIISAVETITELAEKCELWFNDDKRTESVWFHYSATNETAKRALVYDLSIVPIAVGKFSPLLGATGAFYQLTFNRDEAWEDISGIAIHLTDYSTLGALASTEALAAILGDYPARIDWVLLRKTAGAESPVTKIWGGIKANRYGLASVTYKYECEGGTAGTDAAVTTDATASPGGGGNTKMQVTWATTTLVARLRVNPFAADDCAGRYMVLLRHKANTSTSVGIQLATGFGSSASAVDVITNAEVIVTSTTSWHLTELGEVSVPPARYQGTYTLENVFLRIYAERLTAGTTWDMDCILLIPMDHYFSADVTLDYSTGNIDKIYIYTIENGDVYTQQLQVSTSKLVNQPRATTINWVYPIGGGTFCFAFDNVSGSQLTETLDFNLNYYSRHRVHHE